MAAFALEFPEPPAQTVDYLVRALKRRGWTTHHVDAVDQQHRLQLWPAGQEQRIPPFVLSVTSAQYGSIVQIETDHSPRIYRRLREALESSHPTLTPEAAKEEFPIIGAHPPAPVDPQEPSSPLEPLAAAAVPRGRLAPIRKRAIARWIDNIIIGLVVSVIFGFGNDGGPGLVSAAAVVWLWEFGWLARSSATPGKHILNLRVRSAETGEAPDARTSAIRSADQFFVWCLTALLFGWVPLLVAIAYLMVILADKDGRQSPMDRVADTFVTWEPPGVRKRRTHL